MMEVKARQYVLATVLVQPLKTIRKVTMTGTMMNKTIGVSGSHKENSQITF